LCEQSYVTKISIVSLFLQFCNSY